jgi:hypothetical protein
MSGDDEDNITDAELEEQYEAAIAATALGTGVLLEWDPDSPAIERRQRIVVELQGQLNQLRGFDSVAMGC